MWELARNLSFTFKCGNSYEDLSFTFKCRNSHEDLRVCSIRFLFLTPKK
ncbi:hypothetical protein LEP1GSC186_2250 [Leptospira noguchii serovar Autumnalis str. ZUN142]|uniref:Lipoprotein n=1 Tax=Leptospira noguchii serovar Autumnalis str. ZUN142 TaxID=1085540 RepID=M6UWB5_9LEPT|nr:hypothetical protein LEP1GSC186_2250 [Leptospira noguchii serovar Autumnalis str. ZUN142]